VLAIYINGENTVGLEYQIAVYPQAICDEFNIKFDNGDNIHSIPLLMQVVYNEK
jgi:hypothetical protein